MKSLTHVLMKLAGLLSVFGVTSCATQVGTRDGADARRELAARVGAGPEQAVLGRIPWQQGLQLHLQDEVQDLREEPSRN